MPATGELAAQVRDDIGVIGSVLDQIGAHDLAHSLTVVDAALDPVGDSAKLTSTGDTWMTEVHDSLDQVPPRLVHDIAELWDGQVVSSVVSTVATIGRCYTGLADAALAIGRQLSETAQALETFWSTAAGVSATTRRVVQHGHDRGSIVAAGTWFVRILLDMTRRYEDCVAGVARGFELTVQSLDQLAQAPRGGAQPPATVRDGTPEGGPWYRAGAPLTT